MAMIESISTCMMCNHNRYDSSESVSICDSCRSVVRDSIDKVFDIIVIRLAMIGHKKEDILANTNRSSSTKPRAILFFAMNKVFGFSSREISEFLKEKYSFEFSRQNVSYSVRALLREITVTRLVKERINQIISDVIFDCISSDMYSDVIMDQIRFAIRSVITEQVGAILPWSKTNDLTGKILISIENNINNLITINHAKHSI